MKLHQRLLPLFFAINHIALAFTCINTSTYNIVELAREFEITPRAIEFYEDQGLLSPTRDGANGRNRVDTTRERTRLKLTLRGKRLGLILLEIKGLV